MQGILSNIPKIQTGESTQQHLFHFILCPTRLIKTAKKKRKLNKTVEVLQRQQFFYSISVATLHRKLDQHRAKTTTVQCLLKYNFLINVEKKGQTVTGERVKKDKRRFFVVIKRPFRRAYSTMCHIFDGFFHQLPLSSRIDWRKVNEDTNWLLYDMKSEFFFSRFVVAVVGRQFRSDNNDEQQKKRLV